MLFFFLTLSNTLHHHIISKSIRYDDQLPATYAIMMNSSTNNDIRYDDQLPATYVIMLFLLLILIDSL